MEKQVEEYTEVAARKSELERTELQKEKTGVFSGSYAKNPATGEIIPIWVADYVLARFVNLSLSSVSFNVGFCIIIVAVAFILLSKTQMLQSLDFIIVENLVFYM